MRPIVAAAMALALAIVSSLACDPVDDSGAVVVVVSCRARCDIPSMDWTTVEPMCLAADWGDPDIAATAEPDCEATRLAGCREAPRCDCATHTDWTPCDPPEEVIRAPSHD